MPVTSSHTQKPGTGRLLSLDALRGFDMFWIVSGEGIVHGLADAVKAKYGLVQDKTGWQITMNGKLGIGERVIVSMSNQLHHSVWNGFTFYDLIFPLFIFIAGVSMPFSFTRTLDQQGVDRTAAKRKIYGSLIRRTLLLIVLGMVVNGVLEWKGYAQTRFASVLGRIALSCFFAAIIYLNTNFRTRIIWFIGILSGYWLMMVFIPVPGFGAGALTPAGNLSAWFDRLFLPGKLHRSVYDPEGLLSTIPAIATALLGIFTGELLRRQAMNSRQKVLCLFITGVFFLAAGKCWGAVFPVNKTLWSSSFVLYAGGWSLLLLAVFYLIIDVCGFKNWAMPLVWMGCNSILIYMAAHGIVDFIATSRFLFGGLSQYVSAGHRDAFIWAGVAIIQFAVLYFLYRKKLFLKL